ncbi:hypothetical protein LGM89_00695 [Burkholderia sp. AU31624]|uniref:hypothetical protein n=1 Tax=Burkholderia sp. AU31624 TaxID=2879629 RepID=UPI001CF245A7|nr:hypothetical protein [Burkholderia sp. AU31624]MCA8251768.1 hypothetical protein [Burkholderia sp. AU31624]
MSTATNANMPNPGTPVVGPDGRLAPEWFAFFLSLLSRTGGQGQPVDIGSLQKQVNLQAGQINDLFFLENSAASGAITAALFRRLVALEAMVQSVAPVQARAAQTLPDPIAMPARASTTLPEPVSVPQRTSDDLRKLIEARK